MSYRYIQVYNVLDTNIAHQMVSVIIDDDDDDDDYRNVTLMLINREIG